MWSRLFDQASDVGPLLLRNQTSRNVRPAAHPTPAMEAEMAAQSQIDALTAALEQQVQEAYATGLREGEAKCMTANETRLHEIIGRLIGTISEVSAARQETLRQAEADTLRLSIAIARRILHQELSLNVGSLSGMITAALAKLRSQEIQRVRVHPDLEATVRACLEESGRGTAIEVVSDPAQMPGGAVFEINRGSMDASLDTQLAEIEREFASHLGDQA